MLLPAKHDHVLIHESARPLAASSDIEALISAPQNNVSLMVDIPFTVPPVDPETWRVTGSLNRDMLRNVQLPQKFAKNDLLSAHKSAEVADEVYTEDATLASGKGFHVYFIEGHDSNFKVTTPTDIRLASHLLQEGGRHS